MFNLISETVTECAPVYPEYFRKACARLLAILTEENDKFNLTSLESEKDFYLKHIADSLLIGKFFPEITRSKLKILDLGCGAGFPSLVLAAAYPELDITALDSASRKTAFVKYAAKTLNLKNIQVVTGRSRELNRKPEFREAFDIITARAVSEARTIYRETRNMLHGGGRYILYKTPEQAETDKNAVSKITASRELRWDIAAEYELPEKSGRRAFLLGRFSNP